MILGLLNACSSEVGQLGLPVVDIDETTEADTLATAGWGALELLEVVQLPTTDGGVALAHVYFDPEEEGLDWLPSRPAAIAAIGGAIEAWDGTPEAAEAVLLREHEAVGESVFVTITTGEDGELWAAQSGIPLAVADPADIGQLHVDGASCEAIVEDGGAPRLQCGDFVWRDTDIRSHLMADATGETDLDFAAETEVDAAGVPAPPSYLSLTFPVDSTQAWYHYPGSSYHYPGAGFYNADDTYALDLNVSGDCNEPVYAVASGTVKEVYSGGGFVLIEHTPSSSISWLAQSYSKAYSGYGHMTNISVTSGSSVTKGQKIGEVYNTATSSCHLHFAMYVGEYQSYSGSYNGKLTSVDPDLFGSPFTNFDYSGKGYVYDSYVDDQKSSGSYAFSVTNSGTDITKTSSYGILGGDTYTKTDTGSNTATWSWNDGAPSTSSSYRLYTFVPRNYGTTTAASYKVYGGSSGTTSKGSGSVSQNSYYDDFVRVGSSWSFTSADVVKVTLSDSTGEGTGKYMSFDLIRRLLKNDASKMYL